jgi:hypothetical protein
MSNLFKKYIYFIFLFNDIILYYKILKFNYFSFINVMFKLLFNYNLFINYNKRKNILNF